MRDLNGLQAIINQKSVDKKKGMSGLTNGVLHFVCLPKLIIKIG